MKNSKLEWVTGSSNYHVSNAKDHAFSNSMQSIGENYIERRKEGQDSTLKRPREEKDREETLGTIF